MGAEYHACMIEFFLGAAFAMLLGRCSSESPKPRKPMLRPTHKFEAAFCRGFEAAERYREIKLAKQLQRQQ